MKRHAFIILVMVSASFAQAQIFGPQGRVFPTVMPLAAPAPQQGNVPVYTPTTTVFGAALGGIFANDNKTAQGAALGGAVGLVVGQVLDRQVQKRETARRQAEIEAQQQPINLPSGIPASFPPGDEPNSSIGNIPLIDPNTGLPIAPGALPPIMPLPQLGNPTQPTPETIPASPLRPANKLFGR